VIWGAAADDVWAVGNAGSITRFDGSSWDLVRSPGWEQFEAVWGASANSAWAVGTRTPQGMPAMQLAMHWNGEAWSEQAPVAPGGLTDVWVSSTEQAWAVGGDEIVRLR
jgi:hypothetical protein